MPCGAGDCHPLPSSSQLMQEVAGPSHWAWVEWKAGSHQLLLFVLCLVGLYLNSHNGPSTGASSLSGSTKKLQIPLMSLCWVTSNLTAATISAVLKLFLPNKIFRCLTTYPGICQKLEQDNEQLKQNVSWLFFWDNGLKAGNIIAVWVSCIDTVGMDFYRGSNI